MKAELMEEARQLRYRGKSLKEIARELKVSLSSVSRWCTDISLSNEHRDFLDRKRKESGIRALQPWIERNKVLKQNDIKDQQINGEKDLGTLKDRDLFIMGLGLYWGEGYKRGSQEWGFTNSDPAIINVIIRWVKKFYDVKPNRFIAKLTINELYKEHAEILMKNRSKETGIPLSKFSKTVFIKSYGTLDRDPQTYRGTMRLKIRNSTSLRRRVLASIAAFSDQISLNSRKTFS